MKYIYTIYENETDKYYKLEIHEIINHIKNILRVLPSS